jgi:glutamate-ammonia-ligase adenylyltransferase
VVGVPPWPQTDGWLKACSLDEYAGHYTAAGNAEERLALTRARPIAGDAELGARFMESCHQFVYQTAGSATTARPTVDATRPAAEIELLTQVVQLTHGPRHTALRQAGTLSALDAMAKAGLIPDEVCRELDHAYVFLRTAHHRQQLGLAEADLEKQVEASRVRVRELCASIYTRLI